MQRFVRDVKRVNPGASVVLKYDAVEMGGTSYIYHEQEGRVVQSGYQVISTFLSIIIALISRRLRVWMKKLRPSEMI